MGRIGLTLVAAASMATLAQAHDSWLLAEPMTVTAGAEARLIFATGEHFPKSENGADPSRVAQWILVDDSGRHAVTGYALQNDTLAATVKIETEGLHVAAIALKPKFIELAPAKFEDYLKEEGADAALELRRSSGKASEPGREYYTKFAKTFIHAGDSEEPAVYAKPVGHELEIIPVDDPTEWRVGATGTVRVLLRGKAAAGLLVSSGYEGIGHHVYAERVRTNAEGVARLSLSRPGLWYLRSHVMEPIATDSPLSNAEPRANWRSLWASISLKVEAN